MKPPSGRRPRRQQMPLEQRHVVRVLTEGTITETGYLTAWARRNRSNVHVNISDSGLMPKTLVDRSREYVRLNRRVKQGNRDFDEIWCVFDIDTHPNIPQAMEEARQNGIQVAVSNPCFELWLVLHVENQTASISSDAIQERSEELQLSRDKKILETAFGRLFEDFETAKQRAIALDERHAGNGSPRRENPSTGVWRLVDRLRSGMSGDMEN